IKNSTAIVIPNYVFIGLICGRECAFCGGHFLAHRVYSHLVIFHFDNALSLQFLMYQTVYLNSLTIDWRYDKCILRIRDVVRRDRGEAGLVVRKLQNSTL